MPGPDAEHESISSFTYLILREQRKGNCRDSNSSKAASQRASANRVREDSAEAGTRRGIIGAEQAKGNEAAGSPAAAGTLPHTLCTPYSANCLLSFTTPACLFSLTT